jgi:amino acid adenylation domain-containing protein
VRRHGGAEASVYLLLQELLERSAERLPDKVALACGETRATYRELDERANRLAHALRARGVARGDRVAVFMDNTAEAVVSVWGALKADASFVVVNPLTKGDKLAYVLNDCRASALIADAHLAGVFAPAARRSAHLRATLVTGEADAALLESLPHAAPFEAALREAEGTRPPARNVTNDLAAIIYTSGSTGEPKGVMLTHANMTFASWSISTYLGMREDDVVLNVLPLAFDYGLYQLLMTFRVGGRLVLERSFAFPGKVLRRVVDEKVTGFPLVPTISALLAELKSVHDYDFSAVRYVTNTAAALPVTHITMLGEIFPRAAVFSMYGLTECKRCTYLPPAQLATRPTSVGVAIPGTELWIVDEQGKEVPHGTVGQLVIRGPHVMKGYWEKPEQTAARLKPGPVPGELVLYTGDYCRRDAEGYLYFVSRMDDIIKSRGEKVSPKEVENAIYALDGVKECAVIGVPDPVLGQAIKAFVVMKEGHEGRATERDVVRHCQAHLEGFMVPKHVVFVGELPKTDTGKIKKTGLA